MACEVLHGQHRGNCATCCCRHATAHSSQHALRHHTTAHSNQHEPRTPSSHYSAFRHHTTCRCRHTTVHSCQHEPRTPSSHYRAFRHHTCRYRHTTAHFSQLALRHHTTAHSVNTLTVPAVTLQRTQQTRTTHSVITLPVPAVILPHSSKHASHTANLTCSGKININYPQSIKILYSSHMAQLIFV